MKFVGLASRDFISSWIEMNGLIHLKESGISRGKPEESQRRTCIWSGTLSTLTELRYVTAELSAYIHITYVSFRVALSALVFKGGRSAAGNLCEQSSCTIL